MKSYKQLHIEPKGKVSDKWDIYLTEYDRLFSTYRNRHINLLELGTQNGGSLERWSIYFPQGKNFVGCDINPACLRLRYDDSRITVIVGDANESATREKIFAVTPKFDLIVDDGSHKSGDIVRAFANFFLHLNDGGLFVAEDLHCSYWQEFDGGLFYPHSSIAFFKKLADVINHEHWGTEKRRSDLLIGFFSAYGIDVSEDLLTSVYSVEFVNSMCIVRKENAALNRLGSRHIGGLEEVVAQGHHALQGTSCVAPLQKNNVWATMDRAPEEQYEIFLKEICTLGQTLAERDIQIAGLTQTLAERRIQIANLGQTLAERDIQIAGLAQTLAERNIQFEEAGKTILIYENRINRLLQSHSYRLTKPLRWARRMLHVVGRAVQLTRNYIDHRGGFFVGGLKLIRRSLEIIRYSGFNGFVQRLRDYSAIFNQRRFQVSVSAAVSPLLMGTREQAEVGIECPKSSLDLHMRSRGPGFRFWKQFELPDGVEIIVCVHNALEDVKSCVSSLIRHSVAQSRIIIVDDGSDEDTREYLRGICEEQNATLLRNETARGYTFAANQGLRASSAGYVVLLNSDTIVTPGWIEKLVACCESNPKIGLVGPLSNTASWQSIPRIEEDSDWATNPLPAGVSVAEMGGLVAKYSAQLYPWMSFLNGFCLMIRREVMGTIGLFDEEIFGRGYGEENDYCLRARKAGWLLALADDAYVHHAQSKSYSHEKRKMLADHAGMQLATKHGGEVISEGVEQCKWDRTLVSIRAKAAAYLARESVATGAKTRWEGKRILFVLPIMHAGGGGNVVITEARAMMRMGVAVTLLNLAVHKRAFEQSYPSLDVPVIYVNSIADIPAQAVSYDAVIATANHSVQWIAPLQSAARAPALGYYIQDFEPYFFSEGTSAYQIAMASYTLVPTMRLFTKTQWNRDEVFVKTGRSAAVVGASVDVDQFFPRRCEPNSGCDALHVVAMVRPSTPRRNPEGTIEVLSRLKDAFGDRIRVSIFGAEKDGPPIPGGNAATRFKNHGQLSVEQSARLLSSAHLFVDMSHFQAMGLTAMEAMACGAVPVVPRAGGAASFAQHGVNALVVDTSNVDEVIETVAAFMNDGEKRRAMQGAALEAVARFFPEGPASAILEALFQESGMT